MADLIPLFPDESYTPNETGANADNQPGSVPRAIAAELARPTPLSDALHAVDWTFEHRAKAPKIESIHPYPAKFIGDIPATFLHHLPVPAGTAVMDPFCGSGTTLLEAQRLGRQSVGVDLNPIACLISRVKTSPLREGFLSVVAEMVERAKGLNKVETPDIPNVDHWC